MLYDQTVENTDSDDLTLVNASLKGDRDAFAQIVNRYQTLIASVAYSGTGNLTQSEDLAQETFITAWKQLKSLREPGKLRGWLCGIARRVTANARRREQREPVQSSEPLERVIETPAPEALPVDRAITREEEAILWRSLERIPEIYREPLILFYRENHSAERVAEMLELTEEAVRQRLSRGRKLLEERVAEFVGSALRKSRPGPSFTPGVMGALPIQMAAMSSGAAGSMAVKGGAAGKAVSWLGVLISFTGLLPGSVATYLGYKTDLADARTDAERRAVKRFYRLLVACIVGCIGLIFLPVLARPLASAHPDFYATLVIAVGFSWIPIALVLASQIRRGIVASPGALPFGAAASSERGAYEYRSRRSLLGLPLVHIRIGGPPAMRRQPVKAWIAIGDIAVGGLFAAGGVAVAPVALGGFVIAGVLFGGFGIGLLTYAGFGLGLWAMGGLVVGFNSIGAVAIAWNAAVGAVAVAREFAQGGVALALHANDDVSLAYVRNGVFFQYAYLLMTRWLLPTMLVATLPSLIMWRVRRRKSRPQTHCEV
jgi:RNA polymerase sigma factor (sigma-70 family)